MTINEAISTVITAALKISKDLYLTKSSVYRLLLAAKDVTTYKYDRELRGRRDRDKEYLDCLEMEPVGVKDCGIFAFERCSSVMVSKVTLPEVRGDWKMGIISVKGIDEDNLVVYHPTTAEGFSRINDSRYGNILGTKYYYIKDSRLYIPDSEVRLVDLVLIPYDVTTVAECSACTDAKCFKGEYTFNIDDKLAYETFQLAAQMAATGLRIADHQPDTIIGGERPSK